MSNGRDPRHLKERERPVDERIDVAGDDEESDDAEAGGPTQ
ncbi:hypothetical protein [Halobaculum limi]|nr:hypothetical protein [Halobaculum sp. YSMS11]